MATWKALMDGLNVTPYKRHVLRNFEHRQKESSSTSVMTNVFLLEPNFSFANFYSSKEAEKLTLIIFYAITFIQPEMKE